MLARLEADTVTVVLLIAIEEAPKTCELLLPPLSRLTPTPFRRDAPLAKHRKTLAQMGGRGEPGFLPGIQKPVSPRLIRPRYAREGKALARFAEATQFVGFVNCCRDYTAPFRLSM